MSTLWKLVKVGFLLVALWWIMGRVLGIVPFDPAWLTGGTVMTLPSQPR